MMDRRRLLSGTVMLGAGALALAGLTPRSLTGDFLNDSRWVEGLPFRRERVVILHGDGNPFAGKHRDLKSQIQDTIRRYEWCSGRFPYPAKKLDVIVEVMERLSNHYRPAEFEAWAKKLATREALSSTGIGRGWALLVDFQQHRHGSATDAAVDWWLILVPGGMDWNSVDDEPVFAMLAPVMVKPRLLPYLQALEVMEKA